MAGRRGFGKQPVRLNPEGSIRRSQIITTYGPGALVDLVDHAVLLGGLDFWSDDGAAVSEPRLREAVERQLSKLESPYRLSPENPFREPPVGDDKEPSKSQGIKVLEFPQWFVCQNPACLGETRRSASGGRGRALVHARDLERDSKGQHHHRCEDRSDQRALPVRFVAACPRGHLEEFPWRGFVHAKAGNCPAMSLSLHEGATGDFSEIEVRCVCGAHERLSHALAPEANFVCGGGRPWLGREGNQKDCTEKQRLLVRTASNTYFPLTMSALSIPAMGSPVKAAVQSVWETIHDAAELDDVAFYRKKKPKVAVALEGISDAEVLAAIQAQRLGSVDAAEPLRTAEFRTLTAQAPEMPGELPRHDDDFFCRSCIPQGGLPPGVSRVVLAHKLREVMVQLGFTRLEPMTPDLQGDFDLEVEPAVPGLQTDWLPAVELRGEGIFIQLDERAVLAWENRPEVKARELELSAGFAEWAAQHEGSKVRFPGARFYLLHSLSHLLLSALALECGYSASALRERIYCAPAGSDPAMAAILISTGTPGSEGTLGGLVEQGRKLRVHLERAFDIGTLCSYDPVCAGHSPRDDHAERSLEGAACHGCLFVAECSCERFNRYLDRALVVPTVGNPPGLAFFAEGSLTVGTGLARDAAVSASASAWDEALDLLDADWRPLGMALRQAGVPAPDDVHLDLPVEGRITGHQAVMGWKRGSHLVALVSEALRIALRGADESVGDDVELIAATPASVGPELAREVSTRLGRRG